MAESIDWSLWWWFPIGILIASLAMSGGLSGAYLWTPAYLFLAPVSPQVSFWMSLVTMSFGFLSGSIGYLRRRLIVWPLVYAYIKVIAPSTVVGSLLATIMPSRILIIMFGLFASGYGVYFFEIYRRASHEQLDTQHERIGQFLGALGGLLQGLITVGATVLILRHLLHHKLCHHQAQASGTAVVLALAAAVIASISRITDPQLIEALSVYDGATVRNILIFTIPGVLTGGQLGPLIATCLPKRTYRMYVGILLLLIGGLMVLRSVVHPEMP